MVSIEVDGESISPEDITEEAGWLTSHRRRGARALAQLGLTPGHSHGQEGAGSRPTNRQSRAEKQTSRQPRLPRQPPLPKEDIKIVLRPREGLDITKISHAELRDGVLRATGLGYDEAAEDLLRINPAKNIIVASTPSMEHASKYSTVYITSIMPEDITEKAAWLTSHTASSVPTSFPDSLPFQEAQVGKATETEEQPSTITKRLKQPSLDVVHTRERWTQRSLDRPARYIGLLPTPPPARATEQTGHEL